MLFFLVCFYNADLTGKFNVEYVFRDKKMAIDTLIAHNKVFGNHNVRTEWLQIYFCDQFYIPNGDDSDYHVYINPNNKKIKIYLDTQPTEKGERYQKLPLPPIETCVPNL